MLIKADVAKHSKTRATRGQLSKIVSISFFPECGAPGQAEAPAPAPAQPKAPVEPKAPDADAKAPDGK